MLDWRERGPRNIGLVFMKVFLLIPYMTRLFLVDDSSICLEGLMGTIFDYWSAAVGD